MLGSKPAAAAAAAKPAGEALNNAFGAMNLGAANAKPAATPQKPAKPALVASPSTSPDRSPNGSPSASPQNGSPPSSRSATPPQADQKGAGQQQAAAAAAKPSAAAPANANAGATKKATDKLGTYIENDDFTGFTAYVAAVEKAALKSNPSIATQMVTKLINKAVRDDGATALHAAAGTPNMIGKNRLNFIYYLYHKGADFEATVKDCIAFDFVLGGFMEARAVGIAAERRATAETIGVVKAANAKADTVEYLEALKAVSLLIKCGCVKESETALETFAVAVPAHLKGQVKVDKASILAACDEYLKSSAAAKIAAQAKNGAAIAL